MALASLLIESGAAPAVLTVGYLYYEVHYGRVDTLVEDVHGIGSVTLAISHEIDTIDEDAAADELPEEPTVADDFRTAEDGGSLPKPEND